MTAELMVPLEATDALVVVFVEIGVQPGRQGGLAGALDLIP